VSPLLALLLLLDGRAHLLDRHHQLGGSMVKAVEQLILVVLGSGLAKEEVGLTDVVLDEGAEKLIDGVETSNGLDDLLVILCVRATSIRRKWVSPVSWAFSRTVNGGWR
jgi:hypothetical protein